METTGQFRFEADAPHLPLPLGSELLAEDDRSRVRLKVNLVGVEKGRYIVAKLPDEDAPCMDGALTEKEGGLMLSFLKGDAVYGFKTAVIKVVSDPSRLFFLSYPKSIVQVNARESVRYSSSLKSMAMLGNDIVSMKVVDISRTGCQTAITENLSSEVANLLMQVDKVFDLRIQFPGASTVTPFRGRVRTVSRGFSTVNLGIRFERTSEASERALEHFLALSGSMIPAGGGH